MTLTNALKGRTVDMCYTDGERLIIVTNNGQQHIRIIWADDGPVLEGMDARINITPLGSAAQSRSY